MVKEAVPWIAADKVVKFRAGVANRDSVNDPAKSEYSLYAI